LPTTRGGGADRTTAFPAAAMGLVWGLAVGNHLSQIALGLLVALAILSATRRAGDRRRATFRLAAWSAGGLAAGLLVFLWLPLRSMTDPIMDWGAVKSWDRFVWAITRQQWASRSFSESPDGFTGAWLASYRFPTELGWLGVGAALAGMGGLIARRPAWLLWLFAASIPYAAGMLLGHLKQFGMNITYIQQYGIGDWHLPLYLTAAIAAGIGIAWIGGILANADRLRLAAAAPATLTLLMGATAAQRMAAASLRHLDDPNATIRAVLDPLPEDAIVLIASDNPSHMVIYHRWARQPASRRWVVYDFTSLPAQLAKAARTDEGWTMEKQIDYISRVVVDPATQPLRVPAPSDAEIARRPLFTEYRAIHEGAWPFLEPWGMLYKVSTRRLSNDEVRAAELRWRKRWPGLLRTVPAEAPLRVREGWAGPCGERGVYFFKRRMWPEAIDYFARFVRMIDDNALVWYYYGFSLQEEGRPKEAARAYQTAMKVAPKMPGPRVNMAGLLAASGHPDVAEKLLLEELALDPQSIEAKANLERIREEKSAAGRAAETALLPR
jgi:tetratricopeptide (TPR) repeat protein